MLLNGRARGRRTEDGVEGSLGESGRGGRDTWDARGGRGRKGARGDGYEYGSGSTLAGNGRMGCFMWVVGVVGPKRVKRDLASAAVPNAATRAGTY